MELKANELRIGNFINDEQTTHIVVGVDNYYVKSYWLKDEENETLYETPIKLIKPIPLTEEWLFKFGFEDNKTYFTKWINEYETFILSKRDNYYFMCDTDINVNIVHQLQNLYFALTNKELEIKM